MSNAMKGRRRAGRTLISAIALLLFVPSSALGGDAVPLPPEDLVVSNGGDAWRPDDGFDLRWRNPEPVEGGAALVAVHYRVRNPAGTAVVGETRINWLVSHIHRVLVPSIPAAYTAEVWLEDAGGNEGAPAAVKLRFDDVRPADVEPLPKPGWVSRTEPALHRFRSATRRAAAALGRSRLCDLDRPLAERRSLPACRSLLGRRDRPARWSRGRLARPRASCPRGRATYTRSQFRDQGCSPTCPATRCSASTGPTPRPVLDGVPRRLDEPLGRC